MTLLCLGVLIGTGMLRVPGSHTATVHRWLAHGLFIFLWLAAPGAIGVILNQAVRLRPLRAVLGVACCLLAVLLTLVASFTGYLPLPGSEGLPEPERFQSEETRNRFVVLHYFLFPSLCVIVTFGWFLVVALPAPSNELTTVAQDRPARAGAYSTRGLL
jgi:hypothetical protein